MTAERHFHVKPRPAPLDVKLMRVNNVFTYTPPRRTVGRIWRVYRRWAFTFVVGLVAVFLLFALGV